MIIPSAALSTMAVKRPSLARCAGVGPRDFVAMWTDSFLTSRRHRTRGAPQVAYTLLSNHVDHRHERFILYHYLNSHEE